MKGSSYIQVAALDQEQLLVLKYAQEAILMALRSDPGFSSGVISEDDSGNYRVVFEVEGVKFQDCMTITFPRRMAVHMRLNKIKNFQPYGEVLLDVGQDSTGRDIIVSLLYLGGKFMAFGVDFEKLESLHKIALAA